MSITKKISSLLKYGTDPVRTGIRNYRLNVPEIEELARERLQTCSGCLVDEPIDFLRVEDNRIPELDKKMCSDCGCAAPYLFRQSLKKCPQWKQ